MNTKHKTPTLSQLVPKHLDCYRFFDSLPGIFYITDLEHRGIWHNLAYKKMRVAFDLENPQGKKIEEIITQEASCYRIIRNNDRVLQQEKKINCIEFLEKDGVNYYQLSHKAPFYDQHSGYLLGTYGYSIFLDGLLDQDERLRVFSDLTCQDFPEIEAELLQVVSQKLSPSIPALFEVLDYMMLETTTATHCNQQARWIDQFKANHPEQKAAFQVVVVGKDGPIVAQALNVLANHCSFAECLYYPTHEALTHACMYGTSPDMVFLVLQGNLDACDQLIRDLWQGGHVSRRCTWIALNYHHDDGESAAFDECYQVLGWQEFSHILTHYLSVADVVQRSISFA